MSRVASADPALVFTSVNESADRVPTPSPGPLPRILCVDDEPAILTMLERALRSEFDVVTLEDPVAALALVTPGRFSVVIADMRMPAMPGAMFLEQVKARAPTSTRLALTAGLDWQLPPDIAFGILTKPCPLPLLQATISAAVQCHTSCQALLSTPPSVEARVASALTRGKLESSLDSSELALDSGLRPLGGEARTSSSTPARTQRTSSVPVAPPRRLALSVLDKLVELWPRATLLGRAMDCDIVVRDERLAARHLRFFSSWRGVTVQDVSGKGGVLVNGEQLVGVRIIQPGDCISLGPFEVHVQALQG